MRISDLSSDVCSSDLEGYSLITVNGQEIRGENSMAGFEEDDNVPVLSFLSDIIGIGEVGLGGAHDRVWQWYAGTIDTSATELLGNPIFRRDRECGVGGQSVSVCVKLGGRTMRKKTTRYLR